MNENEDHENKKELIDSGSFHLILNYNLRSRVNVIISFTLGNLLNIVMFTSHVSEKTVYQ